VSSNFLQKIFVTAADFPFRIGKTELKVVRIKQWTRAKMVIH